MVTQKVTNSQCHMSSRNPLRVRCARVFLGSKYSSKLKSVFKINRFMLGQGKAKMWHPLPYRNFLAREKTSTLRHVKATGQVNHPLTGLAVRSSHHPTSCIAAILTWVRQHNHYASSTLTPPLSGPPLTANIYMEDLLSNALFQQYKLVSLSKYLFLECLPTPRSFS